MTQVAEYFNRFYSILLRQHLQDPTLHSEWLYFLSMFKADPFDHSRIELYLNILVTENNKKGENKQKEGLPLLGNRQKNRSNHQPSVTTSELKIDKKMSENTKNPYLQNFQFKANPQPLQLRKISSAEQDAYRGQRQSLHNDLKANKQKKEQPFYNIQLVQTPNLNQYLATLGLNHLASEQKQQKQAKQGRFVDRNRRLKEISNRLVKEFETNARLRA